MSSVDLSLGCFFIGMVLNVWLYGVVCLQLFVYVYHFRQDVKILKAAVTVLFLTTTLNTILTISFVYDDLVSHFGSATYSAAASPSFAALSTTTSFVALLVQLLSAWRIWRLSDRACFLDHAMPITIAAVSAVSFACAVWTTVEVTRVKAFADFQVFRVAVGVWLGMAALADVLITGSLIAKLSATRSGVDRIDKGVRVMVHIVFQTGLATTAFAVVDLILYLCSTTTLDMIFNFPLANLYMLSLLTTLNARITLRQSWRESLHLDSGRASSDSPTFR